MSTAANGHEQWADAVGAYLLDALPDAERDGFEVHLAGCTTCRRDVEALRVAADALLVAVPQMEAPPELRARIMGVVNAEAQLLQAAGARADMPEEASQQSSSRRGARAGSSREPWWRRGVLLKPAFAVAAVALLLVAGGVVGSLTRSDEGLRTVVAQVDSRIAPDADVALEIDGDNAQLVASDLPAPPQGRVYQVWIQRGGDAPEPTDTLFVPRDDGSARAALPRGAADADAILVTNEPPGGSDAPTRTPFISVQPA